MIRAKSIGEIFKEVSALPNFEKAKKIEILRQNDTLGFRAFLKILLDDQIEWALPQGAPPYKPNVQLDCDGQLYKEIRRLYLFTKNGNSNLSQARREVLFIQLLEAVTPLDAEVLIVMKDHKLPKGITRKLLEEAYGSL